MTFPMLPPSSEVAFLSMFSGFILQTVAAYGVCRLSVRIMTSPSRRFLVWLLFLVCTAAYWLRLLVQLFAGPIRGAATQLTGVSEFHAVTLHAGSVHLLSLGLLLATGLYPTAVLGVLLLGIWKRIRLARALRFRQEADARTRQLFSALLVSTGTRSCRLRCLPGLSSPASRGWFRSSIYLPVEETMDEAAVRDILLHEIEHVRRRDALWDTLGRLCCTLALFHPCMHKAFSSLRLERELACDLAVIRRDSDGRCRYADSLVHFAWRASVAKTVDSIGIGFTSRTSVLNARVQAILRGTRRYSRRSLAMRASVCTAAFCLLAVALPDCRLLFRLSIPSVQFVSSGASRVLSIAPAHAVRVRTRHAPSAAKFPAQGVEQQSAALGSAVPAAIFAPFLSEKPHVVFRSRAPAIEPGLNKPAVDDEQAVPVQTGAPHSPALSRASLPPISRVVIGAAIALGRLGLAHDRDHEHN